MYGIGRAYGAEFYVKKNKGKLNGWISYTLARTERKVEGLNNNDWFVSRIDKIHNLSVVGIFDISKKWSLGSTMSFATGTRLVFLPTSLYGRELLYLKTILTKEILTESPIVTGWIFLATRKTNMRFLKREKVSGCSLFIMCIIAKSIFCICKAEPR